MCCIPYLTCQCSEFPPPNQRPTVSGQFPFDNLDKFLYVYTRLLYSPYRTDDHKEYSSRAYFGSPSRWSTVPYSKQWSFCKI